MSTIHPEFTEKLPLVIEILKAHKVKNAFLFGSVLTDKFNEKSDVDVAISFDCEQIIDYFSNYMDCKEKLEMLILRKVDIVESQSVQNPIFRNVLERQKQLLYERSNT